MNRFERMLTMLAAYGIPDQQYAHVFVYAKMLSQLYAVNAITYAVDEAKTLKDELVAQIAKIDRHVAEQVNQLCILHAPIFQPHVGPGVS